MEGVLVSPPTANPCSQQAMEALCLKLEEEVARAASVECFEDLADFAILDLRGEGLTALPESFGLLEVLQGVSLSDNQLVSLPESFGQLQLLQELNLSNNRLEQLPRSIGELQLLEELDLANNNLSYVPHLPKLRKLVRLDLAGNCLAADSLAQIGRLTRLQRLDVSENGLEVLPDSITLLESLETLHAHNNKLRALTADIGMLSCLHELDIRCNLLTELPESVCELTSLTSLNVSSNQLRHLPDQIGELIKLKDLSLAKNQLLNLPPLFQLQKLQTLDLQKNPELTSVPDKRVRPAVLERGQAASLGLAVLLKFGELRDLRICSEKDDEYKKALKKTLEADELDLSDLQLRQIPPSLKGMVALRQLRARRNDIEDFPAMLCSLRKLRVLDLYSNKLTGLPHEIGRLESLVELDLSNNQLSELPESIGDLSHLVRLEVGHNKLSSLPSKLTKLTSLSTLVLRMNMINEVPNKMDELQSLKTLDLSGTPLGKSLQLPQQGHCPTRRTLYLMNKYDSLRVIKLHRSQMSSLPDDMSGWGQGPPPKPPPGNSARFSRTDFSKGEEKESSGYSRFFGGAFPTDEDIASFVKRRSAVEEAGEDKELLQVLEAIELQLDCAEYGQRQKLLRTLFRQWHPDKRRDDPELATRVFQWLQSFK